MIWLFLVPFSFLEVVSNGTTQRYFHPNNVSTSPSKFAIMRIWASGLLIKAYPSFKV